MGLREMKLQENGESYIMLSYMHCILKSRRLSWAGHVAPMEQSRNVYRVLMWKSERKRPLERPKGRWDDNIKVDLSEVGYDPGNWIDLSEYRGQWRVCARVIMNLRVR